jgi:hypothetical protein
VFPSKCICTRKAGMLSGCAALVFQSPVAANGGDVAKNN